MPSFPKSSRLHKKSDFDRLKNPQAKSMANCHFVLRWESFARRRIGIVVPSSVGKANQRNLIKRVVREFFRHHPNDFPMGDLVIIARSALNGVGKNSIRLSLKNLLERQSR